jgi:hypothetical protein
VKSLGSLHNYMWELFTPLSNDCGLKHEYMGSV